MASFTEVAREDCRSDGVVTMRDEDLSGQASRYRRMLDDEEPYRVSLGPVDVDTLAAMRVRVAEAMALIRRADPELASEIAVLGRQLVLADGAAGAMKFSGASTFFLWGALIVNPATNADPLALAETLAHESGHALLFGLADAEALVNNPPDERYPSPLRPDPRPMEGIVHATYVLARMERVMRAIASRCALSAGERERASAMAESSRELFLDGRRVVREHARFTDRGRAIFESCVASAMAAPA